MRIKLLPKTLRTRGQLLLAGYLFLALWVLLDWISSGDGRALSPLVLVGYIATFTACTALSVVLYLHRPGRWLCQEKLAALLLLTPLIRSFF
ncbi:hypothetical protein [Cohnella fermenti]|uniref:Uncharacterized protein n=1 Tax=Cohnella fermenti TaxID=2565925 RepID=A0A4S4BHG1_9BACL|nr:hypothetical protein [Cohnella fermenti]THF73725.1 hypothetical protein E6C55_27940 [Cohnella fermenti]